MKNLKLILTVIGLSISILICKTDVSVADIFLVNMVLKCNLNVNILGNTDPCEKLSVSFNGEKPTTKADKKGKRIVVFKRTKAAESLDTTIGKKNEIILKSILIGDISICSGKTEIQMKVSKTNNAEKEIDKVNFSKIKLFTVARNSSNKPVEEKLNASWQFWTPENMTDFFVVGSYFCGDLQHEMDILIGLMLS